MRTPKPRKAAIDGDRIGRWIRDYSSYVPKAVNEQRVEHWLGQFSNEDKDVAARLLDAVQFYGGEDVGNAFKGALRSLPGWSQNPTKRKGIWRFVELSKHSGESGGVMAHRFRVANGLDGDHFGELFISPSMLASQKPGPDHTIVFLDDIVGSGKQVCDGWQSTFQELAAGAGRVFLIVVAAYIKGRDRIHKETELQVFAPHLLGERFNVFSPNCAHFSDAEKNTILKYCRRASTANPKGHGECGLNVVFYHRCPNISLPVLHITSGQWKGLFPRHA